MNLAVSIDPVLFRTWEDMVRRCHYCAEGSSAFKYYRGLGIKVCEEWRGREGFKRFAAHIGPKPSPEHEIDRFPNSKGDYAPGNVRWVTHKQNMRNLRRARKVVWNGESVSLIELHERLGCEISINTVAIRLTRGWSLPDALSRPVHSSQNEPFAVPADCPSPGAEAV